MKGNTMDIEEFKDFLKTIPNIDDYFWKEEGGYCLTTEWLCGTFVGRGFVADTEEAVLSQLIGYLNNHVGHESMVGRIVTKSGWPNLNLVKYYLKESNN